MKKLFIFAFAAILLMVFTTPVMAKFNIGAVIQTDFYWYEQSAENEVGGVMNVAGAIPGDGDHSFTNINVPGWSRFNITWTNEKDVRARFEVQAGGVGAPNNVASPAVTMRHAYGAWQATPNFELMAGWSTTPFSPLTPPQVLATNTGAHIILLGFGEFYSGRFPQVRGTYKFTDNCRLAVALVDPAIQANTFGLLPTATGGVDNDSKLPRIDVGLPFYWGPLKLYPSFFWHQQDFDDVGLNALGLGQENDLDAWGISLGLNMSFGPLTITGELNFGENWAITEGTWLSTAVGNSYAPYLLANGQFSDTDEFGWWIDVALKLGPVTPHLLYGSRDAENEGVAGPLDDLDRRTNAIVFGVTIPVAKTFVLIPEIGWYDYDDGESRGATVANPTNLTWDNGEQLVIGLAFRVIF
jgi:hypothetical protein